MKISIITAAFNSGATLRDTLESVLRQTHRDVEHIIKDGGSSDNTLEIAESFRRRYADAGKSLVIVSERDGGLYDAMNKGIAMATGDVIGILNSDDFYASEIVLETIAERIVDVDAVYGNLDFIDFHDVNKIIRQWNGSQYEIGGFFKGWHPAHPTFYARKKCFESYGCFDTTFDVSADFELMFRFIEKNRIRNKYIPITFVKMRYGGESTGSIGKIIQGNKNVLRAFRKNGFKVPLFYLFRRLFPKLLNIIKNKI